MTTLKTARLRLTPICVDDFDELVALWASPDFTRYISGKPLSEEEVWVRCLRDIGHWQALGHGNWAIRTAETGDYVGTVGVLNYRRTITPAITDPELGWGLAPRFQGNGMAFEAASAALNWLDQTMKSERSLCMITPENTPSIGLAKRLGYRPWVSTRYKDSEVVLFERPRCASL